MIRSCTTATRDYHAVLLWTLGCTRIETTALVRFTIMPRSARQVLSTKSYKVQGSDRFSSGERAPLESLIYLLGGRWSVQGLGASHSGSPKCGQEEDDDGQDQVSGAGSRVTNQEDFLSQRHAPRATRPDSDSDSKSSLSSMRPSSMRSLFLVTSQQR